MRASRFLPAAAATSVLSAGLVAVQSGPAAAQDARPQWTGFYIGGLVGGAWGQTKARAQVTTGSGAVVLPPADAAILNGLTSHDESKGGFTGGLEGGLNYQMGSLVLGVEADWTSLDLKNTNHKTAQSPLLIAPPIVYSLDQQIRTDWMVSLRPRVGYAFGRFLIFATTGLAWTELKYNASLSDNRIPPDLASAVSKSTKTGWTAGLGGAYALSDNLSVKGEWLYADFGHVGSTVTNSFATITPRDSVQTHMFRVGLDYRF